MKILALNAGSNSLKFEIADVDAKASQFGRKMVSGAYDNIGKDGGTFTLFDGKKAIHQEAQTTPSYGHAAELLLNWLADGGAREQGIDGLTGIESIGHRIVHGGHLFQSPAKIDDGVVAKMKSWKT